MGTDYQIGAKHGTGERHVRRTARDATQGTAKGGRVVGAAIVESLRRDGWGMTESAYRHWENGIRTQPINVLPSIAKAIGVEIRDLLPKE